MRIDLDQLQRDIEGVASGAFCADLQAIALEALKFLPPPENISTTECAATSRYIRTPDGGKRLWSAELTPYIAGIQDSLDNPMVTLVVVPGPARSGKTVAAENHLHKRLTFGPKTDAIWFLPGDTDVENYADKDFATYFELHPDIAAKIGHKPSDNKRTTKRIDGKFVNLLPANDRTVRGRQAPYIVGDEIDGWRPKLRSNFAQQMRIRGRAYGRGFKGYACSHPDSGRGDGITAAWLESNRGEWWWPCPDCEGWSSPSPFAAWRTKLDYVRDKTLPKDRMLEKVKQTAGLLCPHCGSLIDSEHQKAMLAAGKWVFKGQTIGVDGTVSGAPDSGDTAGFWIHGTMSPFVSWGELAAEYVAALVFFEETGKSDRLREVTAKSLGEPYDGPAGRRVDVEALKKRGEGQQDDRHRIGTCPPWTRFLTATVDIAGDGFDVLVQAWGADAESAIVDRYKLTAGPDGRALSPPKRIEDWNVLKDVLARRYPRWPDMMVDKGIASMGLDTGGAPGTTRNAYEFGRRLYASVCRGPAAYRLRLFKGASRKSAPEVPVTPTMIERDDHGQKVEPVVPLLVIGVHELKKIVADRVTIDAPGAGYLHFPVGADPRWAEEITNERLIDDDWVRHGDNETFDLLVMAEAVRQLLKPDRPTINWQQPPSWATWRPVVIATEAEKATPSDPKAARKAKRDRLLQKMTR